MNDVTALMGKLKSTVSYLQFEESASEQRGSWPVVDRLARASKGETSNASATSELIATPTPVQPSEAVAPAPKPIAEAIKAVAKSAPSFLRRYGPPPEPTPPVEPSRVLVDIFARLQRKGD